MERKLRCGRPDAARHCIRGSRSFAYRVDPRMEIERLSQVGAFTWMWVVDLGSKQRRKISTNDRLEGKRLFELLTGIAAIGEDMMQPSSDQLEKCGCAVAILYTDFMHDACNQKPRSVSEKVPFASLDLLGGIELARTSSLGGFNRLAVDHSCGGTFFSAIGLTRHHDKMVVDLLPSRATGRSTAAPSCRAETPSAATATGNRSER
jgi:hypothetical protein